MHEININKRARAIRLFVFYALIGAVLMLATMVLVLAARGYDIDRRTGQVIQNGIIVINPTPKDVEVRLNGQLEQNTAPSRYPVPQGPYSVQLDRQGYRSWTANVGVAGSDIVQIEYPILIPEVINTSTVSGIVGPKWIVQSEDESRLVLDSSDGLNEFTIIDIDSNSEQQTTIELPEDLFEKDDDNKLIGTVNLLAHSADASKLAFSYTAKDTNATLLVDIEKPDQAERINQTFDRLMYGAGEVLIALRGDTLIELRDDERVTVVEEGVIDFAFDGGTTWVLVEDTDGARMVVRLTDPAEAVVRLSEDALRLYAERFEGRARLTVLAPTEVNIFGPLDFGNIEKNVPQKVLASAASDVVELSSGGRFVLISSLDSSNVYDLDSQKTFAISRGSSSDIQWLTNAQLSFSDDSQLYIVDFDGSNEYQISGYDSAFGAFINSKRTFIYSVDTSAVGSTKILERSKIDLED